MAAVNNYTHTTTTVTVSKIAGLAGILFNTTATNTVTVSDGGATTIGVITTAPGAFPCGWMPNVALTNSSVVVTLASAQDITILTW